MLLISWKGETKLQKVFNDGKVPCVGFGNCLILSRIPLIRTLFIRISKYSDRLGPSAKHFVSVTVYIFLWLKFFPPFIKYIQGIMY